jgi:glucose-6-phosphate 1-dehydrogenase
MTDTTTLCVLGGNGDLASRLLLPALGDLLTSQPDREVRLVGVDREDQSDDDWRERVRAAFQRGDASGPAIDKVLAGTRYLRADVTSRDDLARVLQAGDDRIALYFALPPAVTARACTTLESLDLPDGLVLALEKPFGVDEASARALNAQLAKLVPESQVQRIDHFLGRSTVLNVLGVRFANRVLEPVWSAEHVESVLIRYDETLGLEDRAGYYDHAGALVDMIQSHLLQVLAIVAMEAPASLSESDLRDAKSAVLRATRVWQDDPAVASRRARYTAGTVGGRQLPSYVDEGGVDPSRHTETLAEVMFQVDTPRWRGVPFLLRSGKALGTHRRELVLRFRSVPDLPKGFTGTTRPSVLRLLLGPDRMELELNVNGPGDPFALERVTMSTDLGPGALTAYGEVLEGVLDADPTLSVRGDTAEQCWRIVQPVLDAWKRDEVPLDEYPAGSRGPASWPRP